MLTLLLFAPSVRYGFVAYDDNVYVFRNGRLSEGLSPSFIRWAFSPAGYASNWHPLSWISLALDVSLARTFGWRNSEIEERALAGSSLDSPIGRVWTDTEGTLPQLMHFHNVVLHAANASLLFILLLYILRTAPCAHEDGQDEGTRPESKGKYSFSIMLCAALSLLWALHPLRCEVVCWVTERKELLSVFFLLLSFMQYLNDRVRWSLACYVCALLAKPVAVSFPVVIFAWELVIQGRPLRLAFSKAFPFAALSAVVCLLTLQVQRTAMGESGEGLLMRIVTPLTAPVVYLCQTLAPIKLSAFYSRANDFPWRAGLILGGGLVISMAWIVWKWFNTRRPLYGIGAFSVAWVYIGLVPMLGIVRVGCQPHSDRYTYWVGCGMVASMALLVNSTRFKDLTVVKGLCFLVSVYALLAFGQQGVWRNTLTLAESAYKRHGDPEAALLLAEELDAEGRAGAAEEIMRDCVSRYPTPSARGRFAVWLAARGGGFAGEAEYWARRALEDDARCAVAYEALGDVARLLGKPEAAKSIYARCRSLGLDGSSSEIRMSAKEASLERELCSKGRK